jgi:hypothetical protein
MQYLKAFRITVPLKSSKIESHQRFDVRTTIFQSVSIVEAIRKLENREIVPNPGALNFRIVSTKQVRFKGPVAKDVQKSSIFRRRMRRDRARGNLTHRLGVLPFDTDFNGLPRPKGKALQRQLFQPVI